MKIKVDTEKYNENLLELATTFKSGNELLDQFIQSKESLNASKDFAYATSENMNVFEEKGIP